VVGVLGKELFDLLPVVVQLRLQHPQLFGTRQRQATLGLGKAVGSTQLQGLGKELQPLLVGFRSRQLMGVKEFFPTAFARVG
jgi:hypothetical protein